MPLSGSCSTSLRKSSSSSSSSKSAPHPWQRSAKRDVTVPHRGHSCSSESTSSLLFFPPTRRRNRRESLIAAALLGPMPFTGARSDSDARWIFHSALYPAPHSASAFARPTPGIRPTSCTSSSVYSPRIRRFMRPPATPATGRTALQCGHSSAPAGTGLWQTGHVGPSAFTMSPNGKRALHALHAKCVGFVAPQSSHSIVGPTSSSPSRATTELHDLHVERG